MRVGASRTNLVCLMRVHASFIPLQISCSTNITTANISVIRFYTFPSHFVSWTCVLPLCNNGCELNVLVIDFFFIRILPHSNNDFLKLFEQYIFLLLILAYDCLHRHHLKEKKWLLLTIYHDYSIILKLQLFRQPLGKHSCRTFTKIYFYWSKSILEFKIILIYEYLFPDFNR